MPPPGAPRPRVPRPGVPRPRCGLPRFTVARRPGCQRGGSSSPSAVSASRVAPSGSVDSPSERIAAAGSVARGGFGGRLLPVVGASSVPRASRPSSHAARAVFAPACCTAARSSRSSVTTRTLSAPSGPPLLRASATSETITSSAERRPACRTMSPDAIRSPRRPGSGAPSKTSSIPTLPGIAPRSRPISDAAGRGAAPRPAWSRLFASTISRSTPSSGLRGARVTHAS
jgi:hypothetical protein